MPRRPRLLGYKRKHLLSLKGLLPYILSFANERLAFNKRARRIRERLLVLFEYLYLHQIEFARHYRIILNFLLNVCQTVVQLPVSFAYFGQRWEVQAAPTFFRE